jgi:hypothetical protein
MLTLAQAEAKVRKKTRHVGDTVRLEQEDLRDHLNTAYRKLRSWLVDVAPQLYLVTSGDIELPDPDTGQEVHLSAGSYAYERLHRVDQLGDDGKWREVELASTLSYNHHQTGRYTFREEGGCLIFGPDDEVEGTFRVLFHATPPVLATPDSTFKLPVRLEDALIYSACIKVAEDDGDDPGRWEKALAKELEAAEPELAKRNGEHVLRAGLRQVLPY